MSKQQWRSLALILLSSFLSLIIVVSSPLTIQKSFAQSAPNAKPTRISIQNVSELKDVQPTDWSFFSVQSLVERYKIFTAYPDKTFQGTEPITRGDQAQWISQIMDRMEKLEEEASQNIVSNEEFASLEKTYISLKQRVDMLKQQSSFR